MLATWNITTAAGAGATDVKVTQATNQALIDKLCKSCTWLRIGYVRVMLPATITLWRLDLVFSPSSDRQGVICLADSDSALEVAEPRAGQPAQWRRDHIFPGIPCTQRFNQGSLRLLCSPLPDAEWVATIDLDIYQPNPNLEPCT